MTNRSRFPGRLTSSKLGNLAHSRASTVANLSVWKTGPDHLVSGFQSVPEVGSVANQSSLHARHMIWLCSPSQGIGSISGTVGQADCRKAIGRPARRLAAAPLPSPLKYSIWKFEKRTDVREIGRYQLNGEKAARLDFLAMISVRHEILEPSAIYRCLKKLRRANRKGKRPGHPV